MFGAHHLRPVHINGGLNERASHRGPQSARRRSCPVAGRIADGGGGPHPDVRHDPHRPPLTTPRGVGGGLDLWGAVRARRPATIATPTTRCGGRCVDRVPLREGGPVSIALQVLAADGHGLRHRLIDREDVGSLVAAGPARPSAAMPLSAVIPAPGDVGRDPGLIRRQDLPSPRVRAHPAYRVPPHR